MSKRAEWRLNQLELPSLRVLRRALYPEGIKLMGQATIVAVAHDGAEVYVDRVSRTPGSAVRSRTARVPSPKWRSSARAD